VDPNDGLDLPMRKASRSVYL